MVFQKGPTMPMAGEIHVLTSKKNNFVERPSNYLPAQIQRKKHKKRCEICFSLTIKTAEQR